MARFSAGWPEYAAALHLEGAGRQHIVNAHIARVLVVKITGICSGVALMLQVFPCLYPAGFFSAFADRMTMMLKLVETVAFTRAECRLAARVLTLSEHGPIHATQGELAAQVGTAREVVSRRFDAWTRKGWIRTGRGEVTVIDRAALQDLAQSDM